MSKDADLNLLDETSETQVLDGASTASISSGVGTTEQVVQKYSHCGLCGGRLHFNYVTDFSRNTTHEKASCPECGLEARQALHRLQ